MPIRRSKFPMPPQFTPHTKNIKHIIEPTGGFNNSSVNLFLNETPFCENWNSVAGYITPRSGLSRLDMSKATAQLGGNQVDFMTEHSTIDGVSVLYAISGKTLTQHAPGASASSWSHVVGGFISSALTKVPATRMQGFWDTAGVLESTGTSNAVAFVNPGIVTFQVSSKSNLPGTTSYISSLLSASYGSCMHSFAEVVDSRLCLFSESDNSGIYPYRVRWSARGSHSQFTVIGSGFEDLQAMQGIPSGLALHLNRGILLTTEHVWEMQPRRDLYAFDFRQIHDTVGCSNPATLNVTPIGPLWLGKANTFYTLQGNAVVPLGWEVREYLDLNLREPKLAWAAYDDVNSQYRFYFSDTTGEYPTRALALNVKSLRQSQTRPGELDGAWWPMDYAHQLTAGASVFGTIDQANSRTPVFGTSKSSIMQELSAQTTDDGTAIAARYRTPVLEPRFPEAYAQLTEAWVEFQSSSTQTVALLSTGDYGSTFESHGSFVGSNTTREVMRPALTSASQHPQVELRVTDGSQPKVARLRLFMREFAGRQR